MNATLITISHDAVPAGSQKRSTLRKLLRKRLAVRNNANTMIATIHNQGDKRLPAKATRPVAFSLLSPRKGDPGPGMQIARNKAPRTRIMP
jgi:hypothetical protein